MKDLFGASTTYQSDLELFGKLRLPTFEIASHDREKHEVGVVKTDDGMVKIWVQCFPAQFWTFEVHSNEASNITTFATGSGSLSTYWDVVEQMLQGMVVIKSVEEVK